eukprot:GILJ01000580.1.p1 GENE.GILJ01000580.1~~GILJ01000580.1.p1  ORF type:complete len:574 (-),score=156.25 GILJ01000580.1:1098-2819(-)
MSSPGKARVEGTHATMENELQDLHRKYRMIEGDRKAYSDDSQTTIRKQRNTIEKLKKDNELLKEELAVESRAGKIASTLTATSQLAKLQDLGESYARKIDSEKMKVDDLDKNIKIMQQKILEQKQKMGGVNAAQENHAQITKQIRILENRLDKALQKFNEAIAHNKKLREQIDSLRRERVIFDNIYKKLEKELHEKKKEMANIIEIANSAYEARDQAQNQLGALKQQADKEQAEFEREWRELNRLIEQDRKMKDFMKLKQEKERVETEVQQKGDMSAEEEQNLKRRVTKGSWGIAKDKASIHISAEKVQSYEEAFAKIQAATGISDIDELVQTFINAEDQNFSLFNFVNELSNEIEILEQQIADIKTEIEKYKGQGANTDNQRKKILKDLEERLARTETKAEQYELKYQQSMKTVNSLKHGIDSIFNRIGCNTSAVQEMLGNQGVTDSNIMQFLGIIEQKTNDLLQKYSNQQQQKLTGASAEEGDDAVSAPQSTTVSNMNLGLSSSLVPGGQPIKIEPPSTGDDFSDNEESEGDDDDERPLTREELKQKTLQGISKRESKNTRGKNKPRSSRK